MKSKYLALGLSAALVLSLVACGGQQAQEPEEPKQGTQQTEPASTEPATPVESEEVKPIETTAPVETETPAEETQPQENLTVPEEQETQQSISTPAVENTPTANKPQEGKPSGGQTGSLSVEEQLESVGAILDSMDNLNQEDKNDNIGPGDPGWDDFVNEIVDTLNPSSQTSGDQQAPQSGSGTGDTLAGEPNNGDGDTLADGPNGGNGTTDSTGLTPAEQAIRDKFLKDNEPLNGGDDTSLTDQDMKDMLEYFFGGN